MYRHRAVAGALLASLALSGCGGATSAERATDEPIPVASHMPADVSSGEVETAQSGDVLKQIGEQAGLVGPEGTTAFGLTVDDIVLSDSCPSKLEDGSTYAPENEVFLVVHVSAVMNGKFAQMTSESTPFMAIDADTWSVLDMDGEPVESHTTAAYGCYPEDERLVPFINPGEVAEGVVVLDTALAHGYLSYNPWGIKGAGWLWEF